MANNKIQLSNGTVLLDLTGDTVDAEHLLQGYTAHDKSGTAIVGTASGGGVDETEYTVTTKPTSRTTSISFSGLLGEPREWWIVPAGFSADTYSRYYFNGGVKTGNTALMYVCHGSATTYNVLTISAIPKYENGKLTIPQVNSNYYYRQSTNYVLHYKL